MFTTIPRKFSAALILSILTALMVISFILAAELITEKSEGPVNQVTLARGGSAEFEISIWAEGAIDCNIAPEDPATARVHTHFLIESDGLVTSQFPSSYLIFYSSGEPDPDPPTGNCGVTWFDAPQPYTVTATISADPGAELGGYWVDLSEAAGTIEITNPPSAARAKLGDNIATSIEVHMIEAEYRLTLEPDEDALYGDPGETVDYTLTLINTGNVPDTFELTFDDNLWDVHLPEYNFELAADESVEVSFQVTIPGDALAGEYDTAIITATSQGDENQSTSVSLTTTANTVYGVTLEPDEDALFGDPGEAVVFSLTLTNTGNDPDTFGFAIEGNEWQVIYPEEPIELEAGESQEIIVQVTIPADALAGDFDTVTITATSDGDENISASAILTTTATAIYAVHLTTDEDTLYGNPGESVSYHLTLTNTANISDTFEISFSENEWEVLVDETTFELEAGESTQIEVQVNIPTDALAGEEDMALITASSQTDEAVSASLTLTTRVPSYGVTLSPKVDAKSGAPGKIIAYNLTLANIGNITDTFQITLSDHAWIVSLPKSSYTLEIGASAIVVVRVTIPPDAQNGDTDTVVVTATSAGDPGVSASAELTTTAVAEPEPEPEPTEFYFFMPIVNQA